MLLTPHITAATSAALIIARAMKPLPLPEKPFDRPMSSALDWRDCIFVLENTSSAKNV
jgi:hypothetical protein